MVVIAAIALVVGVCAVGDLSSVWKQLTGSDDDGAVLRLLERGDQMSGMISMMLTFVGIVLAVVQLRQSRSTVAVERVRHAVQSFLDRKPERRRLRCAMRNRRSRIIIVTGPAGVGKTELVRRVLDEMNIEARWYHAAPLFHPLIDTILQVVEDASGWTSDPGLCDESSLGRLEVAVRHLGTRRAVVVIDSAECLLDGDRYLKNLSLDEAFEALATGPRHGVKVVLVTETAPLARAGGSWAAPEKKVVRVGRLPLDYFKAFAQESAGSHTDRLASLDDRNLTDLYRDLGGRPRLAQLFDAIIANSGVSAPTLAATVRTWADHCNNVTRVGELLLEELATTFRSDRLRVYNAVAAFGTPVNAPAVAALVDEGRAPDDQLGESRVAQELSELSPHAIYEIRDKRYYYLPAAEARRVLAWKPEDDPEKIRSNRRLLRNAAEMLRRRRIAHPDLGSAGPQASLAEIDAWLRADLPHSAFRSIEELDAGARTGNPDTLFRKPRERVAERIEDDDKVANYNVLGYLYHVGGDVERSKEAYQKVLELAGGVTPIRAKVYLNLAWLSWSQDYVEHAFRDFERARDLAPSDRMVVASALEGIARCYRRQGRFQAATTTMTEALGVAEPHTPRWIRIAARLVRLYVDSHQLDPARVLIERVGEAVHRNCDPALKAVYLDALADFHLAQDDREKAVSQARKAVQLALSVNDPVSALQARTTICVVRLRDGKWPAAAREAALAERYRGMEQSLVVIALRGVACRRSGRPADARKAFQLLLKEAAGRAGRDRQDFSAWELAGLAHCGLHLDDDARPIDDAVRAFEGARHPLREPAPTLTALMTFLVTTLATDAERGRLRPAIEVLERGIPLPSVG